MVMVFVPYLLHSKSSQKERLRWLARLTLTRARTPPGGAGGVCWGVLAMAGGGVAHVFEQYWGRCSLKRQVHAQENGMVWVEH